MAFLIPSVLKFIVLYAIGWAFFIWVGGLFFSFEELKDNIPKQQQSQSDADIYILIFNILATLTPLFWALAAIGMCSSGTCTMPIGCLSLLTLIVVYGFLFIYYVIVEGQWHIFTEPNIQVIRLELYDKSWEYDLSS